MLDVAGFDFFGILLTSNLEYKELFWFGLVSDPQGKDKLGFKIYKLRELI